MPYKPGIPNFQSTESALACVGLQVQSLEQNFQCSPFLLEAAGVTVDVGSIVNMCGALSQVQGPIIDGLSTMEL